METYFYNEETRAAWHDLGAAFLEAVDELTFTWEDFKRGTNPKSDTLFWNDEPLEIEFPF